MTRTESELIGAAVASLPSVRGPAVATRVAVVILAYNGGDHLRRAVASVVSQTFEPWECVVVDDGGNEDLSWVEASDDRIRLLRQQNRGVSVARNVGVAATAAPWLAFLDQDDEWLPTKLALQIGAAEDASWSYTGFYWTTGGRGEYAGAASFDLRSFLRAGHICLSTLMVSRAAFNAIGGFNPMLAIQQDADLFARLLACNEKASIVDQGLTRKWLHNAQASQDYVRAYREMRLLLEQHGETIRGTVWRPLYGAQAFDAFRRRRRLRSLLDALRLAPGYTIASVLRHQLSTEGRGHEPRSTAHRR